MSAADKAQGEWTAVGDNLVIGDRLRIRLHSGTAKEVANAHNAAINAAWKEHDDVASALPGFSDEIKQLGARNKELRDQLAAEREKVAPKLTNTKIQMNPDNTTTAGEHGKGLLEDALQACQFVCRLWSAEQPPTPQECNESYEACRAVIERANDEAKP